MTQHDSTTDDLPADLAERLNRLARTQTAQSRPWPGVADAIRRSHRRRLAAASSIAVVGVVIAGTALSTALQPRKLLLAPTTPAATSSATASPTAGRGAAKPVPLTLQSAGYLNGTGGSLAADTGWLDGLRNHVITKVKSPTVQVTSPKDVLMLWAGDLDGVRYAVTIFRIRMTSGGSTHWATGTLEGPVGAAPSAMSMDGWSDSGGGEIPAGSDGLFITPTAKGRHATVALVVAPRASLVEVADTRRFLPDGTVQATWRGLTKQGGAVWAGTLSPGEAYLSDYRAVGMSDGGSSVTSSPGDQSGVVAVSLPGTDQAAITRSSQAVLGLGPSLEEHPVLATSRVIGSRAGGTSTLSTTVLRSADGGYLYGLAEQFRKAGPTAHGLFRKEAVVSAQSFGDPASFMAAVRADAFAEIGRGEHYVVIAPQGATSIRIGSVTAPVRNRLAILDVPETELLREQNAGLAQADADPPPTLPVVEVQALDAGGAVIGTVHSVTFRDDDSPTQTGEVQQEF